MEWYIPYYNMFADAVVVYKVTSATPSRISGNITDFGYLALYFGGCHSSMQGRSPQAEKGHVRLEVTNHAAVSLG